MTLDKSLKAKLSRMIHSYRANISSVSMLDGRGADTVVRKKKKMVETGCMWILIISAAGPNGRRAYGRLLLLLSSHSHSYGGKHGGTPLSAII